MLKKMISYRTTLIAALFITLLMPAIQAESVQKPLGELGASDVGVTVIVEGWVRNDAPGFMHFLLLEKKNAPSREGIRVIPRGAPPAEGSLVRISGKVFMSGNKPTIMEKNRTPVVREVSLEEKSRPGGVRVELYQLDSGYDHREVEVVGVVESISTGPVPYYKIYEKEGDDPNAAITVYTVENPPRKGDKVLVRGQALSWPGEVRIREIRRLDMTGKREEDIPRMKIEAAIAEPRKKETAEKPETSDVTPPPPPSSPGPDEKPVAVSRNPRAIKTTTKFFYYPLNEGQGKIVHDLGSSGEPGFIRSDADWIDADGKTGLFLKGNNARVEIPKLSITSGDFTIEAFLYSFKEPGVQNTVFFMGDAKEGRVAIYGSVLDGKLRFYIRDKFGMQTVDLWSRSVLESGQWSHVVWMKKGDYVRIIINGDIVAEAENAPETYTESSGLTIGAKGAAENATSYRGIIGSVNIRLD